MLRDHPPVPPVRPRIAGERRRRYRAFISYSRTDASVAGWLHRALERYRIPGNLRRRKGAVTRLYPIFRDKEDLAARADLHGGIIDALRNSDALIVICSPCAAASHWVNEEVRCFRKLAPNRPVLALIVDGEPFAGGEAECFPPALRKGTGAPEPIAADLRKDGDGRRLAKLKIIAALIDVPLNELTRRDEIRHRNQLLAITLTAAIIISVLCLLLLMALKSQREAERQREQAEGLIEFMIGDLRKQLEPVGKLSLLDSIGQRAFDYYRAQHQPSQDPVSLGRRARVLHLLGEVQVERGNLDAALRDFNAAAIGTGELLRRKPTDGQRIFDHAQSLYWVGLIAWRRGEFGVARTNLSAYRDWSERLARMDPANEAWQAERGYGASNLGVLDLDEGRLLDARSQFQRALNVAAGLLARKPGDTQRQLTYGGELAWLADAEERLGNFSRARILRERELGVYRAVLAASPADVPARLALSTGYRALSRLAMTAHHAPEAVADARLATDISIQLAREDLRDTEFQSEAASSEVVLSEALAGIGATEAAQNAALSAWIHYTALLRRDGHVDSWRLGRARAALARAGAAFHAGQYAASARLARNAQADLSSLAAASAQGSDARWLKLRANLLLAEAEFGAGDRTSAAQMLEHIALGPRPGSEELREAAVRAEARRFISSHTRNAIPRAGN